LSSLGEPAPRRARPPVKLSDLDARVLHLQTHALEKSTVGGYSTGSVIIFISVVSTGYRLIPLHLHFLVILLTPPCLSLQDPNIFPVFVISSTTSTPLSMPTVLVLLFKLPYEVPRRSELTQSSVNNLFVLLTFPLSWTQLVVLKIMMTCYSLPSCLVAFTAAIILANSSLRLRIMSTGGRSLNVPLGYAGYRLPYHKTDPFYNGTDILFSSQDIADPVLLLHEFVQRRDNIHGARRALFLREDGSHPTRSWFETKLFSFVDRSFGGHSPRAGGAMFYAGLGLSESVIMALGRWTSAAWRIYICDNPCVRAALELAALRHPH
jgi:hypothetical protein